MQLDHFGDACAALDALVADRSGIAEDATHDAAALHKLPVPARDDQEYAVCGALLDGMLEPRRQRRAFSATQREAEAFALAIDAAHFEGALDFPCAGAGD